ncbi:GNAT family N-acetyltransferase [Methanoculleus sp. UBA208]|uniref:GNAT family N-acetyltransferase n=1 Tax=Methanoculleus sp. UBA208 TaxID=1915494 RepID=UPI0025D55DBB|nr:GNAT family N-acetyltransferase [Methanoculleus sp. UBA208]
MTYSIELLSGENAHQWKEFNDRSREGTPFHSLRWKSILEDALNLRLRYYLILKDQQVVGICPFVEQSAGFFHGLNSIPHSEFNNMILDDSFDINHLDEVLSLFAEECSFLHFNTYSPDTMDETKHDNFIIEHTGNMILNLKQTSPEVIWSTFSRNMRYNIQIFEKRGFTIREAHEPSEIKRFYRYYVENLTHINGDILPSSFFERLLDFFPDDVRIAILANGDVFAGGWLTLASPDRATAYYQYLALNRNLPNRYTPTYPVYWDLVNWAWENGYEKLSFGRQRLEPDNPRFQGKAKFGAEYIPIHARLVLLSKTASLAYRMKKRLSGIQVARAFTA